MKKYIFFPFIILLLLYALYLFIGFISMDRGIGKLHYSKSIEEAIEKKTIIKKYTVYDFKGNYIGYAWLEYARSYDIFNKETIEKNNILFSMDNSIKIKDYDLEAFFREKPLIIFTDKNIISIIGIDENMDTIRIKRSNNVEYMIIKY